MTPPGTAMGPSVFIGLACGIEILSMLTLSTFPALIPVFQSDWGITNTEAGIVSGMFFAGELVSVVFLTALMDRFDGRPMFLWGLAMGFVTGIGFLLAEGAWSAYFWRFFQGLALGATYMPGLKILTDHLDRRYRSRGTSFYTATYYLAAGMSYFVALWTEPAFGWRIAFAVSALGPLAAFIAAFKLIPPTPPPQTMTKANPFDLRGAFGNKRAVGFSILYGLHNMELVAFSSWLVPFLVFSLSLQPADAAGVEWHLGIVAAIVSMAALPSSVIFNEVAHKVGRQSLIIVMMIGSAAMGVVFGISADEAFAVVVALAFLLSITIAADSSTITGGVVTVADPAEKGRVMSLYSLIGFTGALAGPIIFGIVLDLAGGGEELRAWVAAFATIGGLLLLGPIVVWRMIGFSEKLR